MKILASSNGATSQVSGLKLGIVRLGRAAGKVFNLSSFFPLKKQRL